MIPEEVFGRRCADFLGWKEEQPGSWFKTDSSAKYVVYSEHNNYPYKGLPFHRDWNWIMEVMRKILSICAELDDMERYWVITDQIPDIECTVELINRFLIWYNEASSK